jgi:hypothetical protein
MYRSWLAGLLTAAGVAASGLLGLVHGHVFTTLLTVAALAAGAGTCLSGFQKNLPDPAGRLDLLNACHPVP